MTLNKNSSRLIAFMNSEIKSWKNMATYNTVLDKKEFLIRKTQARVLNNT